MRYVLLIFVGALIGSAALAQTCEPTPQSYAVRIQADNGQLPHVAGDAPFYQTLDNGWVFALVKNELGWSIRLYEDEPVSDAVDLTSLTPPLRGAPNPRDILGWHFRNADNTAPNTGDVNAPQELRAFTISPGLAGTAGLRPSGRPQEPGPDDGIGWLKIVDYGLANPEPGKQARMNYLQFDACLSWRRSEEEASILIDRASLEFTPEDEEIFGSCGLDLGKYALDATILPRTLGGDIDGDGAIDEVAQVQRKSDGARALALCRAGTWLKVIGIDPKPLGDLKPGFVAQAEAWQWITPDGERPRHLLGYDLPETDGDILVLERVEKEAMLVYWQNGKLNAHRLYGHVEP